MQNPQVSSDIKERNLIDCANYTIQGNEGDEHI